MEVHRAAFELARYTGPLLRLEELSSAEVDLINSSFFELVRRTRAEDLDRIYVAYVQTLHRWGVMCPHPQPHRFYGGWFRADTPIQFEEHQWYDCSLCDAGVINR